MKLKKIGLMLLVAFALILDCLWQKSESKWEIKSDDHFFILFMILQKILSEMKER